MTIKQAIQKARANGFKREEEHLEETSYGADYNIEAVVLDPNFWKALGKAEGWNGREFFSGQYKRKMHKMIDHLIEGKTIEDYFKTL